MRQRTIRRRGSAEGVFEYRFEPETSHRPYFVTRPVALWLQRQLKFPNWTESAIEKMPETHISEWAQAHNAPIERMNSAKAALARSVRGFRSRPAKN